MDIIFLFGWFWICFEAGFLRVALELSLSLDEAVLKLRTLHLPPEC